MNQRHILVVDDDRHYSSFLREHLSSLGFRVSLADNCKTSLEILKRKDTVDAVILDYVLPDGTGTDLLKWIGENETLQKPPVILASALVKTNAAAWETFIEQLPAASQSLLRARVMKPYVLDNMETVLQLVFDSSNSNPPNTITTGDYPHRSSK